MGGYILRRLIGLLGVMIAVVCISFFLMHLIPGDVAQVVAGEGATEAQLEEVRERLGLDQPFLIQLFNYVRDVARLDFGHSVQRGTPVIQIIFDRLPVTLTLAVYAALVSIAVGIPAGILASQYKGKVPDLLVTTTSLIGLCAPSFWRAILFILFFAVFLGWMPAGGMPRESGILEMIRYMTLPAVSLGIGSAGLLARVTRSAMIEQREKDYVRTARAKGLVERQVTMRHVLRNASLPVVTIAGIDFGTLLSGVVVTETVFGLPGLGTVMVQALRELDMPIVLASLIWFSFIFAFLNMLVDISYKFLDPRVTL
jgi:peptide/nickel transport system permease protein